MSVSKGIATCRVVWTPTPLVKSLGFKVVKEQSTWADQGYRQRLNPPPAHAPRKDQHVTTGTSLRRVMTLAVFSSLFLGSLAGTGVAAPAPSGTAQQPRAAQASDPLCKGEFTHAVSNVRFARLPNGRLTWSFKLTAQAEKNLGSLVNVSMPQAFVSGYQINPPYGPHTRPSNYDFHSSIAGYQRTGKKWKGRNFTIKTNDEISFLWLIKSISHPKSGAYRAITCKVPSV